MMDDHVNIKTTFHLWSKSAHLAISFVHWRQFIHVEVHFELALPTVEAEELLPPRRSSSLMRHFYSHCTLPSLLVLVLALALALPLSLALGRRSLRSGLRGTGGPRTRGARWTDR